MDTVAFAQVGYRAGQELQDLIAHAVTEAVVHTLEIICIKHYQRDLRVIPL